MNTNSFTKRWLLALGLGCSMQSLWAQGMIVNELSNGVTGNQEYIELLVVGSAASPTGNVDLRGWIIDDNNGEFEGTTGTGLATGHMRIASSCTALSAVRPGALIVVYNANDVGTIMLAPDPTDANGDNVYVFPHTNVCWERSLAAPSASSPAYAPTTYGSAAIGDWVTTMAFANGGDAGQTRRPNGSFYHGFSYGVVDNAPFPTFPTAFGGGISFNVSTTTGSGQAYILSCGSWTDVANFSMIAASAGSPGAANNAANAQLVQNILDGTFDYTNLANPSNCTLTPCTVAASTTFTQPSCSNGNNGTATVTANNNAGILSYRWSSGNTSAIATGLTAGTYFVTVTDSVAAGSSVTATLFSDDITAASSGTWSMNISSGTNDGSHNFWEINDDEGGVVAGGCGVANNGDATLHVASTMPLISGAAYNAGGLCLGGLGMCVTTNMRAESPTFVTTGYNNITLTFDFISLGDGLNDNCSVVYDDGSGWQVANASIKSATCGSGQGLWTSATVVLPASCNNNPAVRIGFNWTNNDDGVGSDPSAAINNVRVTSVRTASSSNVCTVVDTVVVTAPAALAATNVVTAASCNQSNGAINLSVTGGTTPYTFAWSNGATSEDVSGLAAGTYRVTTTDANGCTQNSSILLSATSSPTVTFTSATAACGNSNGTINLTVTGGTTPYTYRWNNGATSENLSNLQGGVYVATVTSANGCSVTESITVNATPAVTATMLVIEDSLNCDLLPIGELQILPDGGLTPYTYRWSNGTTNQTAASLAAGNYTATVTDANGCTVSASGSIFAPVVPTPNAFINNAGTTATTVTWGSSATINAGNSQNNVSYQWIGSSALNIANATATSTTVTPSQDSTYLIRLVATSVNGCMVSDTLYLTVMSMMQIPTAFSPNGDNNNDRFRPLNINTEYIRAFRIFNRWGEIVYDNKSLSDGGWDGTINGTEQPRDSYIYILEVADPVTNKTSQLRGEFTLVR